MIKKVQQLKIKTLVENMTLLEKAALCSGGDMWNTEPIERLDIPKIATSDGPHGLRKEQDEGSVVMRQSLPATCFPTAAALACSFDRELVHEVGRAIAAEASAADVSVVLGPGVNIKRNPLCGRNFEYFSEDPYLAGEMGAAEINGIQSMGVAASLKHYAVNNQETKRMVSNSCVDRRALHEIYLEPFRRAIKGSRPQVATVMTSYNLVNGEYAAESEYLMNKILREDWGFRGVCVSDWGGVCDRVRALKATLDLEMPGKTSATTKDIVDAVKTGEISEQQLNETATRLLTLVFDCEQNRQRVANVGYEKHHSLARVAAAGSAVLLKNEDNILPFAGTEPFAVIGHFAKQPRYQGTGSSRINPVHVDSVTDELDRLECNYIYAEGCNADGTTNDALIGEARQAAQKAGRAVVFIGLPESYESEGFDREHLNLPDGMLKLVDQVCAVCGNVAVALMLGAPVTLQFADRVKGIVCFYLGGEAAGSAAAAVITGKISPGGKLAETWPKKLGDVPSTPWFAQNRKNVQYREGLYVGYRYFDAADVEPLFAFGHGLSYSEFSYGEPRADAALLKDRNARLGLEVMVTNSGAVAASEVVQVYVAKSGERYKQLKDFQKVFLFPGESRALRFELSRWNFSDFNAEADEWQVQPGRYAIMVGSSSRDIRGEVEVEIAYRGAEPMPAYFPAADAGKLGDEEFYALLGYEPEEPPTTPFTLNSTLGELRRRFIGKVVWGAAEAQALDGGDYADESTKLMVERSLADTPLRAVCAMSRGALKKKQAKAVVRLANRQPLRAVLELLKSEK